MEILVVLLILFTAAALGAWFGADSRDLRDHAWEVPWDRLPRN